MAKLPPVEYNDLASGLITKSASGEYKIPTNAVSEVINMHFDRIGSATLRLGTTALGTSGVLSGNILGLYNFRDSGSGTNNRIIAVSGTDVYYLSGSTWTSRRSSLTADSKARFSTFLDFVFMVNGTEATAIWDGASGNSFLTTGNAANAPTGKYIENFRNRMWIAGNSTYPDRLYYSTTPSSVATPIITWDTDVATGQWIDISPSDGENITALKRTKSSLLVFKTNHIYRVYSISESEPDPKINVGTYSQESVVEAKDGIYFWHSSGPYIYNEGGATDVGRPIVDFVEAVTVTNLSKVVGWEDGDHVYFSIGDVTVDGVAVANCVVRRTISTQVWTVYSYPTQFLVGSPYNDGTTLFRLVGDESGNVLKVNVGLTDNGTNIKYHLTHRWYNVDGFDYTEKTINKTFYSHEGGAGTAVSYQVKGDEKGDWSKSMGILGSMDTLIPTMVKGRKCRFHLSGTSKGQPFTYNGFEIIESSSDPNY